MSIYRTKEINKICDAVSRPASDPLSKKIFFVNGLFGVGKSWLAEQIEAKVLTQKLADAVLKFDDAELIGFLPEFLSKFTAAFQEGDPHNAEYQFAETDYNQAKYFEFLDQVKKRDVNIFNKYIKLAALLPIDQIRTLPKDDEQTRTDLTLIEDAVLKQFPVKADQRILLQTQRIAAESLLVDLMNIFFPIEENQDGYCETKPNTERKKILIIIDNYEPIAGSINKWLIEYFLPYCYILNYVDFVSYNISFADPETKPFHFFDFRFLLFSRENFTVPSNFVEWENYSDWIEPLTLQPFTNSQVEDFIIENDITISQGIEKLQSLTNGIPYMLMLLLNSAILEQSDFDIASVYRWANESILKNKTEEQKRWIQCACFLEDFEENGLRCFPEIGNSYKAAFSYFKYSTELICPKAQRMNSVAINPIIKHYVCESMKSGSAIKFINCQKIASTYQNVKDHFMKLTEIEIEIIRKLSYFKRFEQNNLLPLLFGEQAELATMLIQKYSDWFYVDHFTISLDNEIRNNLKEYNKLVELTHFDDFQKQAYDIWEKFSNEISDKIQARSNELTHLDLESEKIDKETRTKKTSYQDLQYKFLEVENELIMLKKRKLFYSTDGKLTKAAINIAISIIIGIITNYITDGLNSILSEPLAFLIKIILIASAIFFGLTGIGYMARVLYIKSKKSQLDELNKSIAKISVKKEKYQLALQDSNKEFEELESRISEINTKVGQIKEETKKFQGMIAEPFV